MDIKVGDNVEFLNGFKNPTRLHGTIVNIEGEHVDIENVKDTFNNPVGNRWCYTHQITRKLNEECN